MEGEKKLFARGGDQIHLQGFKFCSSLKHVEGLTVIKHHGQASAEMQLLFLATEDFKHSQKKIE